MFYGMALDNISLQQVSCGFDGWYDPFCVYFFQEEAVGRIALWGFEQALHAPYYVENTTDEKEEEKSME